MAQHFKVRRQGTRWLGVVITLVVLLGAAAGAVLFLNNTEPHPVVASQPTVPSKMAAPPSSKSPQTTSAVPVVPATVPPVDRVTGRVDTLGGLVPDFKLPPIVDGLVPVITKIPTEQKVVFLTIDDGAVKRTSDLKLLMDNKVPASLFLAHTFIAGHANFYQQYLKAGYLIEDHTMTHNLGFIQGSYEQQKAEICGMADFEEQNFGRRPVLFRPPGGPYTQVTRKAAADCGMKAIIDWEAKANAGGMDYQVGSSLRPGEIVLMHFRPEFPSDFGAFMKAQKAAGLKVVLLEDYLKLK